MNLNKNLHVIQMTLPATGSQVAPVISRLGLVDNMLLEFWIWASAAGSFARIMDIETNLAPVFGWLPVPASPLNPNMEREISGPPWVIEVQAYNPTVAEITLYLVMSIGNLKEKDLEYRMLAEMEQEDKKQSHERNN